VHEDVLTNTGSTIQRSRSMSARLDFACVLLFALGAACGDPERGAVAASGKNDLVGNPAPDFKATAVAGTEGPISLKALRGEVVLLDFWGTFCEPCKKSFPKLEGLNRKYAKSGLRVIGVSEDEDDDKDKIPGFAATYGATFSLAWDRDKSIARRYSPETMPSSFLIDRNGVVRFAHVGFHDGEERELEGEIRGLLEH
jgi:cytochrome c biogenesis protein CcmG/thiol:disulfide interchange protein DsbE